MSTSKPLHAYTSSQSPKRLQDFALNLKTALDSALPSLDPSYDKVSVIAFHWANDTMGVEPLESKLLEVFRDTYNYDIESYTIPLATSHFSLSNAINSWSFRCAGSNTLRIYVYSGHANSAGTANTSWYLGGRVDQAGNLVGARIDWWTIRAPVEDLDGDMLYIFDCCSAGSVAMHNGPETIAAVGWDQSASASLDISFTQKLIETLQGLNGEPETIAGIYTTLFRDARKNKIGASPVHIPKNGSSSITLARHSKTRAVTRKQSGHLPSKTDHRVLLSVHIRDVIGEPDLEQWTKWLTKNIPSGVLSVDIKIESLFHGSSIILVTMPVEIWTMLPADDPSFNFIGHVASNNVLPELKSDIQSSLPFRPIAPSGEENQPFSHRQRKSLG